MESRTLGEIAEEWRAYKRRLVKPASLAAYGLMLKNHILPCFGECRALSESGVQEFALRKLDEGLSIKTVKDILIVLKMVMKFGVKNGWMAHCEWEVKYPTVAGAAAIEILTVAQHRKILSHIRRNFSCDGLGVYISLTAGLRIGEVCGLRWADIDTERGVICVRRTLERIPAEGTEGRRTRVVEGPPKTASSRREIPMSQELMKMTRHLKKVVNEDFFVITNSERPTEPRAYRNHYYRLLERLDIPRIKYHSLRHSFATRCIECNCDYKTVSVLLGHSNISTTLNTYVHPDMEQKKRCIFRMVRRLGE